MSVRSGKESSVSSVKRGHEVIDQNSSVKSSLWENITAEEKQQARCNFIVEGKKYTYLLNDININ